MAYLHQNEQIIIRLSFISHTMYNNVGSYHLYMSNRQMIKCVPNHDLCSYTLYDKERDVAPC